MAAQTIEALELAFTVETVSDETAFFALHDSWNEILENSASNCVFLTWEWLSCWWKHLKSDYSLSIRLVRQGTQLIAIAPFAIVEPHSTGVDVPFAHVAHAGRARPVRQRP